MSRPQSNRSPVALGGMLAALSVAFAAVSQFMPMFFGIVAPLPLAVAVLLVSLRFAVLITVVASLLVGLLLGPLAGVGFACQSALMGMVSGALVKKKRSYGSVFIFVTVAQAVGMACLLLVQFALMGFDWAAFSQSFLGSEEAIVATAQNSGVFDAMAQSSGISAAAAEATFRRTTHVLVQMTPSIYLLLFAGMTAVYLMLLHWLCGRMGIEPNVQAAHLKTIIMPAWMLVPFLGAWVIVLANRYLDIHLLWIIAVNVMVIGAACMAVDGFSYTIAKLKFSEASTMMKMLYIFLAFFMGMYLLVFFALVGVFDCISDYRHLRTIQKGA